MILDTNVLVAAGFNPRSSSARLIKLSQVGKLVLVWNQATLKETKYIVDQIPPLNWGVFEGLFNDVGKCNDSGDMDSFGFVEDPDDRKFAALAEAVGCPVVTNDIHLLAHKKRFGFEVLRPSELLVRLES